MENDPDDSNPIVPHNSIVDCRLHASPTEDRNFSRKVRRHDFAFRQSQPVKKSINDGRAAIDSLKSRLYDKPENSEVFRAIHRPGPPSSGQAAQVSKFYKLALKCSFGFCGANASEPLAIRGFNMRLILFKT